MSSLAARWTCEPYPVAAADEIGRALGLGPATAQVLARRGYASVEAARSFLAAGDRHDPGLLQGIDEACELILGHVRRGGRIVVHGDYDADGVCSTAILVESLRELGADPSWHLPSRLEGYGLSQATVARLAAEGASLLITADCGITSVAEVKAALALGVDVVVTDHHRPAERLPPCPVLHPGFGEHPFHGLCGAGVAHKLSAALRRRAGLDAGGAEEELDLVAIATVCDLVPLRGENRRLVREGLRALARTRRPGLRALMRVAALEPGGLDESAVGFRLGPRLNAAGRMRRADAALELLLTRDEARAEEVADELDFLNRERRDVETRILFAAESARAAQEDAPAYVVAGEGWHPGVVGIVASRMAERHHRPCVVIGIGAEGGRGSGRSIPAFDLHAALGECRGHLRRFGGHRAAAGLEIEPDRIDAFRRDLAAHAAAVLSPHDLVPVRQVDAVVPGSALGLGLAEELRRLAPFGHGNPEPTLLVPAARVSDVRPMGEEAQHSRFTLVTGGGRAQAVAFRSTPASLAREAAEQCHAAVRLELREWNGAVEARAVLSALCASEAPGSLVLGEDEPFWPAVERALADEDPTVEREATDAVARPAGAGEPPARLVRDRRGEGIAGVAGELLSSGERVLLVCADVARRRETLERLVAGLARGGEPAALPLVAWDALERNPGLASGFPHLVAIDPPARRAALRLAGPADEAPGGFLHLAWGPAEVAFALAMARASLGLRGALAGLYRGLRAAGGARGEELRLMLAGEGRHPRRPVVCARMLRVLLDLRLIAYQGGEDGPACRALEASRTPLERSPAWRALARRLEEAERYLGQEAARLEAPAIASLRGGTEAERQAAQG